MEPSFLFRGFAAGLVATLAMLPAEISMLRRFGPRGVYEWHEIQASLAHRGWGSDAEFILLLHGLAGGVAGLLFAIAVSLVRLDVDLVLQGLGLGVLMWLITLVIHGPITSVRPWRNDMGRGPVAASLLGHLLFSAALGFLMIWP